MAAYLQSIAKLSRPRAIMSDTKAIQPPLSPPPTAAELVDLFNKGHHAELEQTVSLLVERYPGSGFLWKILGASLQVQGKDGLAALQKTVTLLPNDAEALCNLGTALMHLQRHDEAAASFRQALAIKPDFPEAHNNLGIAQLSMGQAHDAMASFRQALSVQFAYPDAHNNLGIALKKLGRIDEAAASYRQALALSPTFVEAHNNLGNALRDLGLLDAAAESYRAAIGIAPHCAEAHGNLGIVLMHLGKLDDAVASYRQSLTLRPDVAETQNNLGNVLRDLGRLAEAADCFQRALAIKCDYAEAMNNLGNVLRDAGRHDEAEAYFRKAIDIKPEYAEAHNNLGNVFRDIGRLRESLPCYRKALELKPDYAEAHANLGNALMDSGQIEEALACYRKALLFKPASAEMHSNLGNALTNLGRFDAAMDCYRQALAIKPELAEAHSNLLFADNYIPGRSATELLTNARIYGDLVARHAHTAKNWPNIPDPTRPLRVGLVSGDLRSHPVGHFVQSIAAALASRASARLALFAYPSHFQTDALSAKIRACCQGWHTAVGLTDARLAELIRNDRIDILIDLSGHTAHNRLAMFAWKPAPIQISWLGYFATTGIPQIDYLLADPWTIPPSEEAYFTEKIWRLPETRLCFTPPDTPIPVSPLPALTQRHLTFGCFNNLAKINDSVLAAWAGILHGSPNSRLFLKAKQLDDPAVRQGILDRFAARGISPDRLILEGPSPRDIYLAAYQRVDIALDPFPFTGGTTSVESLWMGVPVLTLAGTRLVSRQGLGIAMNAGLPDWVAADLDDYIARARAHAADLPRLAALRARLRRQVLASPLFDACRFAAHFETALRGMWHIWCAKAHG